MVFEQGELILYQSDDGQTGVDVRLYDETIWLTLNQMAELFERDKSVVSRHLRNIYQSGELQREATVAKNATVQREGGREVKRDIECFNLDAIISVGYRVNSMRGTQFRIWATSVLKDHLVKGYTLNQKRLAEKGVGEVRQMLALLAATLKGQRLVGDEGVAILDIITHFAKTWQVLWQYDEDSLPVLEAKHTGGAVLEIDEVRRAIETLRRELMSKVEATDIFGNERGGSLPGIIGAVRQTFDGHDLYPGVEEKAAHLLYFIIKDHPFTDGNKRIGSFLFLLFLKKNGLLDVVNLDNKALVALTLLTASSDPGQKDLIIRLIVNLLSEE